MHQRAMFQLGSNFVFVDSISAIKGDKAKHQVTVEYCGSSHISVVVKPKAFASVMEYCLDAISGEDISELIYELETLETRKLQQLGIHFPSLAVVNALSA